MMGIYIPSRSRWQRSLTLEALNTVTPSWPVFVVVPTDQESQYGPLAARHGAHLLSCPAKGIALTRQWCGEHARKNRRNRFLMLDDDLRFYHRKSQDSVRLYKNASDDTVRMLSMIEERLDGFAHVSISARQANHACTLPYEVNSRGIRALAFRVDEFLSCEHGRVPVMEDFDIELQLLRRGFAQCTITCYAQDQVATQQPGGCSDYRTHAVHEAGVRKLAELHTPFVKMRMKHNVSKTKGNFGDRLEATIYWEKAYESSKTSGKGLVW